MAAATSPYDPGSQEATYWQARQRLASATRALNEKLVSTDIDPELAAALADMARASKTKEEAQELREIIDETQSDAGVGPATSALLGELRKRRNR